MGEIEQRSNETTTGISRITELDAVRGFALCGIHVVNIYQQVVFAAMFGDDRGFGLALMPGIVRYGFYERFLPIFTLLFGIGFAIFLDSADRRTTRPRLVLARRLVALGVIGALHQIVHPGEVLLPYAVFGLVFLLPASFLKPRTTLIVGLTLLVLGGQTIAGYGVMPGLLVIGLALARMGVPRSMGTHLREWLIATGVFGVITAAYLATIVAGGSIPTLSLGPTALSSQLAAVAAGMLYTCLVVLLLRTPIGGLLIRVLAPMGRMALTNYLLATALILVLAPLLGIDHTDDGLAIAALVVGIIVVEAVWSPLWLRRMRFGPAEWAWRCATWWQVMPIRRRPEPAGST
ncbi:DUF418 domain-containing protein [Dietzia sp. NPDC055340]